MSTPVDLIEAVVAQLKADPLCVSLLTGGVFSQFAGAQTAEPFAVVIEVGGAREHVAGDGTNPTSYHDDGTFQVSAFAPTRSTAVAAGHAIMLALNDAALTFSGGTLSYLRQTNRYCERDPDLGKNGVAVWHELREFRFIIAGEF